jgi:hypothetical protein
MGVNILKLQTLMNFTDIFIYEYKASRRTSLVFDTFPYRFHEESY